MLKGCTLIKLKERKIISKQINAYIRKGGEMQQTSCWNGDGSWVGHTSQYQPLSALTDLKVKPEF